jgi:uncharacterized coiled-coil protein SlyX
MTYDELEAQYYIVLQQNKNLEQKNNDLYLRNSELETENVLLENSLNKAERTIDSLSTSLTTQLCSVTNLKILLEEATNKLRDLEKPQSPLVLPVHERFDWLMKL